LYLIFNRFLASLVIPIIIPRAARPVLILLSLSVPIDSVIISINSISLKFLIILITLISK